MIVFDLTCKQGHVFEAWFKDGDAFERQRRRKLVECAVCGSTAVRKAPMAPRLSGTRKGKTESAPQPVAKAGPDPEFAKAMAALRALRDHVEKNSEDVGERFAEEARKIHYDEAEKRNIRGRATDDEAKALADEGIEFARLPWVPRDDA